MADPMLCALQRAVNLAEGIPALESYFVTLWLSGPLPLRELAARLELPVPLAGAIKHELKSRGLAESRGGVRLTGPGEAFVLDRLGYKGVRRELLATLISAADPLPLLAPQMEILEAICRTRPDADTTLDQAKCTPATAMRRAVLCLRAGALIGKQVVCLGDDDMTGAALALLLQALYHPGKSPCGAVTSLDVDARELQHIGHTARRYRLALTPRCHDLRDPLPASLAGRFDGAFTDPPYTLPGASLFLRRACQALGGTCLPLFFSMGARAPDFSLRLQRIYCHLGLVASRIYPGFNQYEGAQLRAGRSTMHLLRTAGPPVPASEARFEGPLYTAELRKRRLYRCLSCGAPLPPEPLASSACPRCGALQHTPKPFH